MGATRLAQRRANMSSHPMNSPVQTCNMSWRGHGACRRCCARSASVRSTPRIRDRHQARQPGLVQVITQLVNMLQPERDRDAPFSQHATHRMRCLRALVDPHLARSNYGCQSLRGFRLDGHDAHRRSTAHRHDRGGIDGLFLPFHAQFHIDRRDQADLVTRALSFTSQKLICAAIRFHEDLAGRRLRQTRHPFPPGARHVHVIVRAAGGIGPVDGKTVLCNVHADDPASLVGRRPYHRRAGTNLRVKLA